MAQQISSGLPKTNASGSYNIAGELINFQTVGNEINITLTDSTTGAMTDDTDSCPDLLTRRPAAKLDCAV